MEEQLSGLTSSAVITPGAPFALSRAIITDTAQWVTVTYRNSSTGPMYLVPGINPVDAKAIAATFGGVAVSGAFAAGY